MDPILLTLNDFREILERAAKRFQSKQAFARAVGLTPSRFSRVLRGESMEVVNCLKVAKLAGEAPSRVLRAAGKGEIADLIEELYRINAEDPRHDRELSRALVAMQTLRAASPVLFEATIQHLDDTAAGVRSLLVREPPIENARAALPSARSSRKAPRRRAR
jgi:hypothetical protein